MICIPRVALAQVAPTPGAQPAPPAAAPATDPKAAKAALAAAAKAVKAKDWATALTQFQAAMNADPTAQALEGLASVQYELKMQAEAYDSYATLLHDYSPNPMAKKLATARVAELAPLTGYISIRVNEAGADVSLDGKSIGQSPVAALIRVMAGPHKVDVSKSGFNPVSKTPNVGSNGKEIVDVQLAHEATTGHLSVKEKDGQPVRVMVDGADVGAAPLDLEVAPGEHEIILRNSTMASLPEKVTVAKGQTVPVELSAVAASAHLEIVTSDRKGIIFLDAKPVAEGTFTADVPAGPHIIAVTREGYERYEKKLTLADKQSLTETVTLQLPEAKPTGPVTEERSYDGIYGGLGALMALEPFGGEGNELDTNCVQLAATSCSTSSPLGGGLQGFFGYAWHPFGVEAFLMGEYDEATPSAKFVGPTSPLENPLAVGAPRVEQFTFMRFGGTAAIRARYMFQTDLLRVSLAAGAGFSFKDMLLFRQSESNSGGQNAYFDKAGRTYISPAVNVDLSVALRTGKTTAIAVGVFGIFENAGQGVISPAPTAAQCSSTVDCYIPHGLIPVPIATPQYHLASGAQTFIGPYLGLEFGP
jgi:hypothetical protein